MFAAMLDTCVLYPSTQRDFLLSMAVENLYRPLWSLVILDELYESERIKHIDRGTGETAAHHLASGLVDRMRVHFDDACVQGWEGLEGSYGLPDPDDEHVVAASVVGGAGAIVTANLRDFPPDLIPSGIQVLAPAEFAANTVDVDPDRALRALEAMAARRRNPPESVEDLLAILEHRYGMESAVATIRAVSTSERTIPTERAGPAAQPAEAPTSIRRGGADSRDSP